jgi:hypothetical protein
MEAHIFLHYHAQTGFGPYHTPNPMDITGSFCKSKANRCEINHSSPSGIGVIDVYSYEIYNKIKMHHLMLHKIEH